MGKVQHVMAPRRILRRGKSFLLIEWNDRVISSYKVYDLRAKCPCVACVNQWTGERILDTEKIDEDVHPLRIYSVGPYAMGITWSDGHETGIYSYDYLRSLDTQKGMQS